MHPNPWRRAIAFGAALAIAAAFAAYAYELPLSPEEIREAYFLGRHDHAARDFLAGYLKAFPSSQSSEIEFSRVELLTPYAQIVSAAHHDMLNDNAVDADQYYQQHPSALVVKIWAYCPSASGYASGPFDRFTGSIRQSSIVVSQVGALKPVRTSYITLYEVTEDARWPNGLEVDLQFDAGQFRPAPVQIDISSPDGQHVEATFDLAALK